MARHAIERLRASGRALSRLLFAATPGRRAFALRQALACAAVAWVVEFYQTPDAALTVYVVFFLNAADRMTSVVMSVVELLLVTLVIALVLVVAIFTIDDAMARVACMGVLSFGWLFLASASKLRPIAPILALIVGYGLDLLGGFHSGEVATRALLYAWLFVGIPACVSLVASLLAAPSPRRLLERALAARLRLCAAMLRMPGADTRRAFAEELAQAPGKLPEWLKMAALEASSPPVDLAALRQAEASSIALMLLVDLATREDGTPLPAAWRTALADVLEPVADMLAGGGYPLDVTVTRLEAGNASPPLQAAVLDEFRGVLAGFAEPLPVAATPVVEQGEGKTGFLLPDAFSSAVHVQYALKATAAALTCYVLYELLDWPGIHTCFITCYIVALPTAAETIEKLTLRIAGCLVGALVGTAAIVFLIPATTSIGGLMAIVFTGAFACAWIAAGSPRIAYAGFQVAFAFFLCVMQGAGPAFDLTIARDRVIGILLGNLVAYLFFTRLWPVGIAGRIDPALARLLRRLGDMVSATTVAARRAVAAQVLACAAEAMRDLELAHYEPGPLRPSRAWLRQRRVLLRKALAATAPLLLAAAREATPDAAFGQRLERLARRLQGDEAPPAVIASHAPGPDATWAVADAALQAIEGAAPRGEAAGSAGHVHALA
jgi:multidrug resistance protein MdtO